MARRKKAESTPTDLPSSEDYESNTPEDVTEVTLPEASIPEPQPTSKPQEPESPAPIRPLGVSFTVFAQVSGIRLDRLGGFKNYAARTGLGPMDVKEWHAEYQKFLRLPV